LLLAFPLFQVLDRVERTRNALLWTWQQLPEEAADALEDIVFALDICTTIALSDLHSRPKHRIMTALPARAPGKTLALNNYVKNDFWHATEVMAALSQSRATHDRFDWDTMLETWFGDFAFAVQIAPDSLYLKTGSFKSGIVWPKAAARLSKKSRPG